MGKLFKVNKEKKGNRQAKKDVNRAARKTRKKDNKENKDAIKEIKQNRKKEVKEIRKSGESKSEKKAKIKATREAAKADAKSHRNANRESRDGVFGGGGRSNANWTFIGPGNQKLRNQADAELAVAGLNIDPIQGIPADYNRSIQAHIRSCLDEARRMSGAGLLLIDSLSASSDSTHLSSWNREPRLTTYFGIVEEVSQVNDVRKRLSDVNDRLNKKPVIELKANPAKSRNARNWGWGLSGKKFKIYPRLFEGRSIKMVGAVFIHELIHVNFFDQRNDGRTVYGRSAAIKLAVDSPKKARRSAENYEWYCLQF